MLKKIFMFMIAIVLVGGVAYAAPAAVPKTGQTTCYDAAGNVIACAGTGQDGELQKGVVLPDLRFTAGTGSGDLCVTDNLRGLMWVRTPDSILRTWAEALTYANGLSLCGYDDWWVPNLNELQSLAWIGGGNPAVWLNAPDMHFSNVKADDYWTATTCKGYPAKAWVVNMRDGGSGGDYKTNNHYVWPVRAVR